MREPLDTDLQMPKPLVREDAAQRLLELLAPDVADVVWDELIAPLYDAREFGRRWPRGNCAHCHVPHPAVSLSGKVRPHRTYCPRYVGPLEHNLQGGNQSFAGWRLRCSCGQSWLEYAEGERRETCPDAAVDWRGPRPDGSCSPAAGETVPNNQETP